jgi:hypothetical protein
MRLMKSLLCGFSALALATGAAFAGGGSAVHGSVEASEPQLLSDENFGSGGSGSSAFGADVTSQMNGSFDLERGDIYAGSMPEQSAMQESEVIYIYPVQVTEYYLLIPSQSSEMPG